VLDVGVVGGGVIRSSIAYHLARSGARVRVYEQAAPAVAPSAFWASAGGVRQQGRDPREWPLTLEAARRWPGLHNELGAPTGFVQRGHLHLVEAAADLAALEQRVADEKRAGIDISLLEPTAAYAIAPSIKPGILAATTSDARVRGLRLGSHPVTTEAAALATGVWTNALTTVLHCEVPIMPSGPQMLWQAPVRICSRRRSPLPTARYRSSNCQRASISLVVAGRQT